jgi:hypothetical protein
MICKIRLVCLILYLSAASAFPSLQWTHFGGKSRQEKYKSQIAYVFSGNNFNFLCFWDLRVQAERKYVGEIEPW